MKGNIICGWSGGGRAEEGVLEFLSNKNNLTRFFLSALHQTSIAFNIIGLTTVS